MQINLPLLSDKDPLASTEGALNPLGLFSIADSLANKLIPGVRERQSHPRFLTAIAVSLAVCSGFAEEMLASDRISEPWQVFEWYMVEGLVRTADGDNSIVGLPGRDKATQAIRDKVSLSASRYLKTPSVFGFHGVYRVLAREMGIEFNGRLGDVGYTLLKIWMEEQELKGFYGPDAGRGREVHQMLYGAVKDGLDKGSVTRQSGWAGWKFFREHLAHRDPASNEAAFIVKCLRDNYRGHTKTVLDFLISTDGRKLWNNTSSEKDIHKKMISVITDDLKKYLQTIIQYEAFSRLLQDSFDDCLFCMSKTRQKTRLKEFTEMKGVIKAYPLISGLYSELIEMLEPYGETDRFSRVFGDLADKMSINQWVETLLAHHFIIQRNKPPNGKAPWFERFDDGAYIIRPAYVRNEGGKYTDEYVHAYRTNPLWSFARDLHLVN